MLDPHLAQLIDDERKRQQTTLTMIPSENYASAAVSEAQASVFGNKYAEGYPGNRYYGGTEVVDELELTCRSLAQEVFNTDYHVNVQPYSGSPANLAALMALAKPTETIMGMDLNSGGHLTHGHKVSASGKLFNSVQYGIDEKSGLIDYEAVAKLATEYKPKIIIAGLTAYPREIDFKKFAAIAKSVNAFLLADISHISGLVATNLHQSPFGYADVVMTTTHKMLRGPRGAILFSKTPEIASKIDKAVFPLLQGGPHMNTIAGIAQALVEAKDPDYKAYCLQIIANARIMTQILTERGFDLVTGGSDNHLWLIDLRNKNINGVDAQELLENNRVVVNKNSIPFDPASPSKPSGVRMGTPAITTRGFTDSDAGQLADIIADILENKSHDITLLDELIANHPIPSK